MVLLYALGGNSRDTVWNLGDIGPSWTRYLEKIPARSFFQLQEVSFCMDNTKQW